MDAVRAQVRSLNPIAKSESRLQATSEQVSVKDVGEIGSNP